MCLFIFFCACVCLVVMVFGVCVGIKVGRRDVDGTKMEMTTSSSSSCWECCSCR